MVFIFVTIYDTSRAIHLDRSFLLYCPFLHLWQLHSAGVGGSEFPVQGAPL
jgi:hypothetical protein